MFDPEQLHERARRGVATLALYVGIVETLADEADRDDDGGETMH